MGIYISHASSHFGLEIDHLPSLKKSLGSLSDTLITLITLILISLFHSTGTLFSDTPKRSLKMTSTNNELSTPLIGNLPQHEYEYEHARDTDGYDEEDCMDMYATRSLNKVIDNDEDDEESKGDRWFDDRIVLTLLPALLFLQFGGAFYMARGGQQADTGLCWSVVNYSIVMFVIIAALYRRAVKDCNLTTCSVVVLMPEIIMDVVLCLVLFGKVVPGFFILLCGNLVLATLVVASNIRVLVAVSNEKAYPKDEDCDEDLQDELAYFGGFEPVITM